MRWEAKKKIKELLPLKVPFHLNILSPQVTGTVQRSQFSFSNWRGQEQSRCIPQGHNCLYANTQVRNEILSN